MAERTPGTYYVEKQGEDSRLEAVACDLCGEKRSEVVVRQRDFLRESPSEEFTVVRCLDCGLLYLNPRPDREEIGRHYPEQYFSPAPTRVRTGIRGIAKRAAVTIKRWIREEFYGYPGARLSGWLRGLRRLCLGPEYVKCLIRQRDIIPWTGTGRLLDIGCGAGANMQTLQEQGWDARGIELSGTAVAFARERVGDRIHHGTLETAPYRDGSFDVVLMSHSLEHMFSPVATLKRAHRLLQPSGLVVIAVPNAGSLEARLFGRWWFPWELPRHLYHFDRSTLAETLRKAGFRVILMRTAIGSLFFMASLERFWTHRLGRALVCRWLIERALVRPLCFFAGHLGYGTEIRVYAVKEKG